MRDYFQSHRWAPLRWVGCAALAVAVVLPAPNSFSQQPPDNPDAGGGAAAAADAETVDGLRVGPAVAFRNIALFPLVGDSVGDDADVRYLTLDEGIAEGLVTVSEIGANATATDAIEPSENNASPDQEHRQEPGQDQDQDQGQFRRNALPPADNADAGDAPAEAVSGMERIRELLDELANFEGRPRARAEMIEQLLLALIAEQQEALRLEAQRLQVQGRDIRPEMDAIAGQLQALDALVQQVRQAFDGPFAPFEPPRLRPQPAESSDAHSNDAADDGDPQAAQAVEGWRQQLQQQMQQQQEFDPRNNRGNRGAVQQSRRGSAAEVNLLEVANESDRPLYLMSGELLLGGQQDRIVAVDTIVPPKSRLQVRVFCVEPGRWGGTGRFGSGQAVVHTKLRQVAQDTQSQGEIWDEVRRANRMLGTETGSNTYRENLTNDVIQGQTTAYLHALHELFEITDQTVGVAVAIHGEVVVIDRFGTPAMFRALFEKLLKSYVLAAIVDAADRAAAEENGDIDAEIEAPAIGAVVEFYAEIKNQAAQTESNAGANVHSDRRDAGGAVGFENYHYDAQAAEAGEKGRLLHESFYRK